MSVSRRGFPLDTAGIRPSLSHPAATALVALVAQEGLALINGTQFITSLTAEALVRAELCAKQADIIAAVTMEAVRATPTPFEHRVHAVRGQVRHRVVQTQDGTQWCFVALGRHPLSPLHPVTVLMCGESCGVLQVGQIESATRLRAVLHSHSQPSEIFLNFPHSVQDAYSLRCVPQASRCFGALPSLLSDGLDAEAGSPQHTHSPAPFGDCRRPPPAPPSLDLAPKPSMPQVHGIVHDTVHFVKGIISRELNAATDNPMVFAEDDAVISAGNFHGEYPAKVSKQPNRNIITVLERLVGHWFGMVGFDHCRPQTISRSEYQSWLPSVSGALSAW